MPTSSLADEASAELAPDARAEIEAIAQAVDCDARGWHDELTVSIGRASALSGLKVSQIRYFEQLDALHPLKESGRGGASRMFTITDLRRLRALALLSARHRPAEAADLLRRHVALVEHGARRPVDELVGHERNAVADGFVLARVLSQVIDAFEAHLAAAGMPPNRSGPLVRGLIFPLPAAALADLSGPAAAVALRALAAAPGGALIALRNQPAPKADDPLPQGLRESSGRDDQTVVFYSPEPHPLELPAATHARAYVADDNADGLLLLVDGEQVAEALPALDANRVYLLDRLLHLARSIFAEFRTHTGVPGYRFRSDGFPLALSRDSLASLLVTICASVFPGDPQALAALLVPDSIDAPTALLILAHHNYDPDLAPQARLPLGEHGEGLCGRAYALREPFLSLQAESDPRMAYGPEEHSRVALAVPLATTRSMPVFGVLYLASRSPNAELPSTASFFALVLGNILSELLGRWWLTRMRKELDAQLHRGIDQMIGWLDSLDDRGPSFQRALAAVRAIWERVSAPDAAGADGPDGALTLVVLDIVGYRQTVQMQNSELLPLQAQLHVQAALARALPPGTPYFWFQNDHALLLLDRFDAQRATVAVQGVKELVSATPVSLGGDLPREIAVCAAAKTLSYRSLCQLAGAKAQDLDEQVTRIVDWLRKEAGRASYERPTAVMGGPLRSGALALFRAD